MHFHDHLIDYEVGS